MEIGLARWPRRRLAKTAMDRVLVGPLARGLSTPVVAAQAARVVMSRPDRRGRAAPCFADRGDCPAGDPVH